MKRKENNIVSYCYYFIMFIIFPLILHNYLFDVVQTKYGFFVKFTVIFSVLALAVTLIFSYRIDWKIRKADIFIAAFLLVNIISYFCSSDKVLALKGNEDRAFGLVTIIMLALTYFMITRFLCVTENIAFIIMFGSIVVALIGMLNFFAVDPLGIYKRMVNYQHDFFIGTLGHTNIYSSFFSITLPIGVIMYIKSKKRKTQIFYFSALVISFAGLIAGNSDSGFITILTCVLIAFVFSKTYKEMARLFTVCASMVVTAKIFGLVIYTTKSNRALDSLMQLLVKSNWMYIVFLISCLVGTYCFICNKKELGNFKRDKRIVYIIVGAALLFFLQATIYVNITGKGSFLAKYLLINDKWGNNRGFIWKRCISAYGKHYNLKDKIIGCGPDSLFSVIEPLFGAEIQSGGFEHFNNAHNEFLQYLMTTGILGLASYIGIIVFTVKEFISKHKNETIYIAVIAAIGCYLFQSIVNVNQVITTPLLFICISLVNYRNKETTIHR